MTVNLTVKNMEGEWLPASRTSLSLPSLPATAFAAVSEDELVVRRVGEVVAAQLQECAHSAARRGDWAQVRRLLGEARQQAKDNAWAVAVVQTLEALALRQDAELFSKEARYASRRMSSRVAALHENSDDRDEVAMGAPSFLRRKREQGKAER